MAIRAKMFFQWLGGAVLSLALSSIAGCADQPPAPPKPPVAPVPPHPPAPTDAPPAPPAKAPAAAAAHVVVELYADSHDTATAAWVQTQVAAWQKAGGEALTVKTFNPDDKTNYARLTALEAAAGLKAFAAVEAFVYPATAAPEPETLLSPAGLHPIALVGKEAIEQQTAPAVAAILHPRKGLLSAAQPEVLKAAAARLIAAQVPEFILPKDFPGEIDPAACGVVARWWLGAKKTGGQWPGVELVLLYRPIDCPVCADTELLVLAVNGKITGIESLRPIERYGAPIPEEAQRFLMQFAQQQLDGGLEQRLTKVDGIAGATKTATNVKQLLSDLDRAVQPAPR